MSGRGRSWGGGVERVAVEMGDGVIVEFPVLDDPRRAAGLAGRVDGVRPAAADMTQGFHESRIERASVHVQSSVGLSIRPRPFG